MTIGRLRYHVVASMIGGMLALPACGDTAGPPSGPTAPPTAPSPAPAPLPDPAFPSIVVGEVVRFSFTVDDRPCVGGGGRCHSYNISVPADGTLQAVLTSVSGTDAFIATTEMYVVYSAKILSEVLELRTSVR